MTDAIVPNESPRFLPNSKSCFVCGEENPAGLQTRFFVDGNYVKMPLNAQDHHCGYANTVHGGVVAAALDECMGWAASRAIQRMCVTADLTVRYLHRVPADVALTVRAEVTKSHKRMVQATAVIIDAAGKEYARAEGRFLPLSVEETLEVDDALLYRGDEERIFDTLRAEYNGAANQS
ncbi:MAG: PaaI family thioesterase [Candidatus Hydrogenedentes bacterium]|nr:PaaI family thioesterase [Candidatus Hydrogenedentota bacterium]